MTLHYINWFAESQDGSREWLRLFFAEMSKRGHEMKLTRLQRDTDSRFVLIRRLLMLVRLLDALVKPGAVVIQYPFCFSWIAPLLKLWRGYVLDTTDTQHIREVVAFNGTPWFMLPVFHAHYWSWRVWHRFANRVRCNSHFVYDMAPEKSWVLYDVYLDGISYSETPATSPVVGWLGSAGTECWLDELIPAFQKLRANGVTLEFIGGTKAYADKVGAVHIPWTQWNLMHAMAGWSCGLAYLPCMVKMPGKLHGKILQYMAAGIPVVASPQGESEILLSHSAGSIVRVCDEAYHAAMNFCRFPETAKAIGMLGHRISRAWVIEKYADNFCEWTGNKNVVKQIFDTATQEETTWTER